jgi:tetratricopeptide (TPR) repeat protein
MLGAAIRELVSTVLDESKVLSTIPLDQLTDARRAAQVPDSARLTFELARHLAYRTAVRSVVEGRVDRLAKDSYSIVVRARDVEDERVLIAVNGTASSKTIIPTVERLARDVGTTLLAHRGPGLAPPSLDQPITASFDAYRRYVAALQRMDENGDYDGAVELLREAVALDSNFAAAWWQLGDAAIQTPQAWRVGDAYDRARRLSDRLTITQRLALEASVARADGEPPRALDNWDQLVAARPTSAAAFFGRARILRQLGRYDEAVESFRKALQLTPLGPRQIILSDLAITLAPMGRIDEARSLTVQLSGVLKREAETLLALVEENWQRADSLFAEAAADPTLNAADRSESAAALAACEAARGHVAAANQNLLRADEYVGLHESLTVDIAARLQLLALAAGGKAPTAKKVALSQGHTRAGIGSDTALNGHLMRGLVGVWSGDTASSRRELRALLTGPGAERGMVPNVVAILDGWMSSREERWPDVVRALAPIARGNEQQPSFIFALTASRWLVADAYERLGQPDSAAAFFERLVRSPHFHDQRSRGLVSSFAHRRLARLYDRMGKHDMARRHWQTFLSTFTEPDPELRPLVEEARVALSRAFEDSKALESASSLGASWFELIRSKESPVSR